MCTDLDGALRATATEIESLGIHIMFYGRGVSGLDLSRGVAHQLQDKAAPIHTQVHISAITLAKLDSEQQTDHYRKLGTFWS